MRIGIGIFALAIAATSIASAATIDGSVDAGYGVAKFVQDTPTGYGDNNTGSTLTANGSEIDGIYGQISGGNLNLIVTGNVETNFNRLVLFFDAKSGGDQTVGTTATAGSGPLTDFNGLKFDAGFTADYFLLVNGGGAGTTFYANDATIGGTQNYINSTVAGAQGTTFSNGIVFGFDNSNVAGVTGASAAGGGSVTTGFEFSIPLSVLGDAGATSVKVAGFIAGAGGGSISNQLIGGIGGGANLGNASGVDLTTISGNQFVTFSVPEPTTLAAGAGAAIALLRRRRMA